MIKRVCVCDVCEQRRICSAYPSGKTLPDVVWLCRVCAKYRDSGVMKSNLPNSFRKRGIEGEPGYAIIHVPERKQVALCRLEHNITHPIAYFRDDSEAERFIEFLNDLGSSRVIELSDE